MVSEKFALRMLTQFKLITQTLQSLASTRMTTPNPLTPDLAAGVALHVTLAGTMVSKFLRPDHRSSLHYHNCIEKFLELGNEEA